MNVKIFSKKINTKFYLNANFRMEIIHNRCNTIAKYIKINIRLKS